MNAADLVPQLSLLRDAPGGIKRLRELILQLAVQGKLVPQDPADESAEILLERIREEKRRLVAEGKIKRDKPLPAIREDEKPYPLPPGWVWVRLGGVACDLGQKVPDKMFTYIDVGSIDNIAGKLKPELQVLSSGNAPSRARRIVSKGTVIFSTVRPYLLNTAIIENEFDNEPIASTAFAILHPHSGVMSEYLHRYLRSSSFMEFLKSKMIGVAYPAINNHEFFLGLFPLPPHAEQARIVAKVEALMRLCDALEERLGKRDEVLAASRSASLNALASAGDGAALKKAWDRVAANLSILAADEAGAAELKRAILQLAVQGKLVPQDPADESAEILFERIRKEKRRLVAEGKIKRDKPLPAIREDEKPYVLPLGWMWVRVGIICWNIQYGYTASAINNLKVKFLRITDIQENTVQWGLVPGCQIEDEKVETYRLKKGDMLIARTGGTIGKSYHVLDEPPIAVFASYLIRLRPLADLNTSYFKRFLESQTYWMQLQDRSMGTGQPNVNGTALSTLLFPLPPLAEQKRIVAKVEELMGLCDRLAGECRKERDCAERWAAAATAALTGIVEQAEEEKMRAPKTELVSSLTLKKPPSIKDDAPLAALLSRGGGEQNAKALWQSSGLEIDAFYRALKREMDSGWISEGRKAAVRETDGR